MFENSLDRKLEGELEMFENSLDRKLEGRTRNV